MRDHPNIELYIDRITLNGIMLTPGQRHLLQAAMQAELEHLLTIRGLSRDSIGELSGPYLSTQGINLTGNGDPVQMGRQIAQTVYQKLSNGT